MANNLFNISDSINGDAVVGFTSAKEIKNISWADASTVASWLQDGENTHKKHLGLINLFNATHKVKLPFLADLFKNSKVIELYEGESLTYDLPVKRVAYCTTAVDTSLEKEYPGIDGGIFSIVLDTKFTKGDIITFDPQYGEQLYVDDNFDVEREGENYRHYVRLVDNNKRAWYPKDKLKAGIQYYKIGHGLGEFGTDYSQINLDSAPAGTIRNEFILGNMRGVETFYTRKASKMKAPGLQNYASHAMEKAREKASYLGKNQMFFMGNKDSKGNIVKKSLKVAPALEYFALMELHKLEAYQLLFQKAAVFPTGNGTVRFNEGVWHQMRRGKLIQYAKPGGITKSHLQEVAAYLFKNRGDIPVHERRIKFKAGYFAYQNVMEIFREEINHQLGGLANLLAGNAIIKSPLQGPLDALELKPVIFKAVSIPGLGTVEVEHDPSLDYQPFADRFSGGFFGDGYAHTSYSLVIWDAASNEYSNATSRVKNGKLVKGGDSTANVYYVKPEGAVMEYGYEQGRMANGDRVTDIQSSIKQQGRTFWAHSQSAALVLDTTRYIVIELKR